jgi:uncharacterized protein (TIGR02996 family)
MDRRATSTDPLSLQQQSLLAAICVEPSDDAPRLVYADWLEEHGDTAGVPAAAARAEFIRVQCESARLPEYERRRKLLEDRADDLLCEHETLWRTEQRWPRGDLTFRRGFLAVVAADAADWLRRGRKLAERCPIESLRLTYGVGESGAQLGRSHTLCGLVELAIGWDRLKQKIHGPLLASPHLAGLRRLVLLGVRLTPRDWLLRLPLWERLTTLSLSSIGLRHDEAEALLTNPRLGGLISLDLSYNHACRCGPILAQATNLSGLQEVRLEYTGLGVEGITDLVATDNCASWSSLCLTDNWIGDEGVAALARSPHLGPLGGLDLCANGITDAGVRALAGARWLSSIQRLDLSHNGIGPEGLPALLARTTPGVLHTLKVGRGCLPALAESRVMPGLLALDLDDDGEIALPELQTLLGRAESLRRLDLSYCQLGPELAEVLAAVELPSLRELNLSGNQLGDGGMKALAGAPWLSRVRKLGLDGNEITAAGLQALLDSPGLGSLLILDLGNNVAVNESVAALASCPRLTSLRRLRTTWYRPKLSTAQALVDSPHLPDQLTVEIIHPKLPAKQKEILKERFHLLA